MYRRLLGDAARGQQLLGECLGLSEVQEGAVAHEGTQRRPIDDLGVATAGSPF